MFNKQTEEEYLAKKYRKKFDKFRRSYNNRFAVSALPTAAGATIGGFAGQQLGGRAIKTLVPNNFKIGKFDISSEIAGKLLGGVVGGTVGTRIGLPHTQRMAAKRLLPSDDQVKKLLPANEREQRQLSSYLKNTNIGAIADKAKNLLPRRSDLTNLLPSSSERRAFDQSLKSNATEYSLKKAVDIANKNNRRK